MSGATLRGLGLRMGPSAAGQRTLRLMGPSVARLTGRLPWLALSSRPVAGLPGPDWARVRPLLAGICGSDLSLLTGKASATLSPYASFPAVLGHEVVGVVEEAGGGVPLASGRRVAIDPTISCLVRGLEPCQPCRDGQFGLCLRTTEGSLSPGMLIGFCRDLPGGWSDGMLAHASQLHPVPDELSDEMAVLVEPLSISLHGVLADLPAPGERILVIGGGTIGLGALIALRLVAAASDVTVVVRHPVQRELAARLGATRVVDDDGGRGALGAAETVTGARSFRTLTGGSVLSGGFERVYDCVGSPQSLATALASAGPRGRIVLIGSAFDIPGLDWSVVWARELQIRGSYLYGREGSVSGEPHTFDHLLRLLVKHPELPVADLVTHRFPLDRWPDAIGTALGRGGRSAVKVVFDHRNAYPAPNG